MVRRAPNDADRLVGRSPKPTELNRVRTECLSNHARSAPVARIEPETHGGEWRTDGGAHQQHGRSRALERNDGGGAAEAQTRLPLRARVTGCDVERDVAAGEKVRRHAARVEKACSDEIP